MAFGKPSFIATALLGPDLAKRVSSVRSATQMYGSTSGPFGGMSGSAMTTFTMTEFRIGSAFLYFADDRYLGWAQDGSTPQEQFPKLHTGMGGLKEVTECPVAEAQHLVVGRADPSHYVATVADISRSLVMGCEAEADDPSIGPIARSITMPQVAWISSWLAGEGFTR